MKMRSVLLFCSAISLLMSGCLVDCGSPPGRPVKLDSQVRPVLPERPVIPQLPPPLQQPTWEVVVEP